MNRRSVALIVALLGWIVLAAFSALALVLAAGQSMQHVRYAATAVIVLTVTQLHLSNRLMEVR